MSRYRCTSLHFATTSSIVPSGGDELPNIATVPNSRLSVGSKTPLLAGQCPLTFHNVPREGVRGRLCDVEKFIHFQETDVSYRFLMVIFPAEATLSLASKDDIV